MRAGKARRHPILGSGGNADRFGLLLSVLVTVYLLSAFISASWVRTLQVVLFLVVGLLAVRAARVRYRTAHLMIVIAVGGSAIALVLALAVPTGPSAGIAYLWMASVLLVAVVLIVQRVLVSRNEVTLQSIFGAISAYVIIGLMFSAFYAAITKLGGGAFFADGRPGDVRTYQYFSFATLTTVGYGDFTAAASGGRAVAVMEALVGQVFLATLVARLVSAYRAPAGRGGAERNQRPRPARRNDRYVAGHHGSVRRRAPASAWTRGRGKARRVHRKETP